MTFKEQWLIGSDPGWQKTKNWNKTEIKSLQKFSIWEPEKKVPQGLILGTLLSILYINDIPTTIHTLSEHILFADVTSLLISGKNFNDLPTIANTVLSHISIWFTSNMLVLNLHNTNIIKFITNHHGMI
jgi:hypothetical protein